jgi:hypothetical protein
LVKTAQSQADKQPEESRGQGYVFKYAYFNTDSKISFTGVATSAKLISKHANNRKEL